MRSAIFYGLTFFALLFGAVLYYHNSSFVLEGIHRGFLLTKKASVLRSIYLPAFYVHIVTGSLVLVTGIFQLSKRIRERIPKWHRAAGKFYVVVVLFLTAPSGFIMSFYANGGLPAQTGFGLLAVLWWYFTWRGWRSALNRDWNVHRQFMLRSYVLTFAAVTLRMYSFIFALMGMRGESIYTIIVWLSWVPSLIVVELWVRVRVRGSRLVM